MYVISMTKDAASGAGRWAGTVLLLVAVIRFVPSLQAGTHCLIINGLGGLPEYEENFVKWSDALEVVCKDRAGAEVIRIDGRSSGRDAVAAAFDETVATPLEDDVWLFLIGHANAHRDVYKFNIKGPDIDNGDLIAFLNRLGERRTVVVAATGSSGLLVPLLSGKKRIVVTATRGPREKYPPLFLSFFIESLESNDADTDKNGRVSVLESYRFSRDKVGAWFKEKGRIQTEHALLADGDSTVLGTKPDRTSVSNASANGATNPDAEDPEASIDTATLLSGVVHLNAPAGRTYATPEAQALARQRTRIERNIEDLKFRKREFSTEEYYEQLESLLVQLAETNRRIEELEGEEP